MSHFSHKFLKVLKEDYPPATAEGEDESPESDEEAFNASLDPETPEGTFNDVPTNPVAEFEAEQQANTINILTTWIGNVESFIEQLNGLSPDSMNAQLNQTDCGSILSDVARSESKKISRLAQDLSSLGESLKQYLLAAQNKDANSGNI
jgi:hypothetical protein